MLKREKLNEKLITVELADEGFVAAGRVVPFPTQSAATTIVGLSKEQAQLADQGLIKTMTVLGNSLEGIGIFDGDKVVVKKAFSKKEITPRSVCIVYIPTTGEVCAKRIRFGEGLIVLESCNPNVSPLYHKPDDVEIRGVVIGMHRSPDIDGRFDRGVANNDIPF